MQKKVGGPSTPPREDDVASLPHLTRPCRAAESVPSFLRPSRRLPAPTPSDPFSLEFCWSRIKELTGKKNVVHRGPNTAKQLAGSTSREVSTSLLQAPPSRVPPKMQPNRRFAVSTVVPPPGRACPLRSPAYSPSKLVNPICQAGERAGALPCAAGGREGRHGDGTTLPWMSEGFHFSCFLPPSPCWRGMADDFFFCPYR